MADDYLARLNDLSPRREARHYLHNLKMWRWASILTGIRSGENRWFELDCLFLERGEDYEFVSGPLLYLSYLADHIELINGIIRDGFVLAFCNLALWEYTGGAPDIKRLTALSLGGRGKQDNSWLGVVKVDLLLALLPGKYISAFIPQFYNYTGFLLCGTMNNFQKAIVTRDYIELEMEAPMAKYRLIKKIDKAKVIDEIYITMTIALSSGSLEVVRLVSKHYHCSIIRALKENSGAFNYFLLALLKNREVNNWILSRFPLEHFSEKAYSLLTKLMHRNFPQAYEAFIGEVSLGEKYYLRLLGLGLELLLLRPTHNFLLVTLREFKRRHPESDHTLKSALIAWIKIKAIERSPRAVLNRLHGLRPAIYLVTKLHAYIKINLAPTINRGFVAREHNLNDFYQHARRLLSGKITTVVT